jgi:hypothetical protein
LITHVIITDHSQTYEKSKGKELSGTHNYALLSELFHSQSSRWEAIAKNHVTDVCNKILAFTTTALKHIITDPKVFGAVKDFMSAGLKDHKIAAKDELKKICADERRHPQTYNHYYTDNIQKARLNAAQEMIDKTLDQVAWKEFGGRMHIANNGYDTGRLKEAMKSCVNVDMSGQACAEAMTDLKAYYKVSLSSHSHTYHYPAC